MDFERDYPKADVWSVGWILYEMFFGNELWDYSDVKTMTKFITNDDNSDFFSNLGKEIPEKILDFLKMSLVYHPDKRMSWNELMSHPLLQNCFESEKVRIIETDLSKVDLSLKKEEIYCKCLFDVKGLDDFGINQSLISGYSNEYNLINRNYEFEIYDYFHLFDESKELHPFEGKVAFRAYDRVNQKNFILRIFEINVELNENSINILRDCCYEYLISKIQRQIGANVLNLYEIFVNNFDFFERSQSYLILVHDNLDFFLLDLLESLEKNLLELTISQKLYIFLAVCQHFITLKRCNFNRIQAVHPQNIVFCRHKITNKLSIKLAFFNDVTKQNNNESVNNELVTPSLKKMENKGFEQRWKGVVYHLGVFLTELLVEKKFFNSQKSFNLLKEKQISDDLFNLVEGMLVDSYEERLGLEEIASKIDHLGLITERDFEFLRTFKINKSEKIDEKKMAKTLGSINEILFQFNKAGAFYEKVLELEQKTEEMIDIMCQIASNFLLSLDYDKCNGICYKALSLLKGEKSKSEKTNLQMAKFKLNLMNGISLMTLNLPDKAMTYLEDGMKIAEKLRVINPLPQTIIVKYLCDNYKTLGKLSKALSMNEKSLELLKKLKEESYIKKKLNADFLLNFSQTYLLMANHAKAFEFCNDAIIFNEKNFPEFHPFLKQCHVSLGNLNFLQGFFDKAVHNFEYALNINNKIFPPGHESFIDLTYDLATVYSKTNTNPSVYLKHFENALELFQNNPHIRKTVKEKKSNAV